MSELYLHCNHNTSLIFILWFRRSQGSEVPWISIHKYVPVLDRREANGILFSHAFTEMTLSHYMKRERTLHGIGRHDMFVMTRCPLPVIIPATVRLRYDQGWTLRSSTTCPSGKWLSTLTCPIADLLARILCHQRKNLNLRVNICRFGGILEGYFEGYFEG